MIAAAAVLFKTRQLLVHCATTCVLNVSSIEQRIVDSLRDAQPSCVGELAQEREAVRHNGRAALAAKYLGCGRVLRHLLKTVRCRVHGHVSMAGQAQP